MYVNYLNDRKQLGYECLKDTLCGNKLVLITDSSVVFVKHVKHKTKIIIYVIILTFSEVQSAEAIGMNLPPQQIEHRIHRIIVSDQDANKLMEPSKLKMDSDIEPKIIMPSLSKSIGSVRTKFDLKNSQWIKEFVSGIRGGADEKLIRSIISKVSEADWDIPSINKILKKLAEVTLEIGTNDKLLRILAELEKLEKPVPNSLFAEGFVPQWTRHRKLNKVENPKYSSPSIEFLLDSMKCYGHREAYNTPRSVSESLKSRPVKKLYELSLKNSKLKKEYKGVKDLIEKGIHPVNIGKKSTFVSPTKVLVKKSEGRYLVDVSDTHAEIVGVSARTNKESMSKFGRLMNEMYKLDIKGY